VLIDHGADVNVNDGDGDSPLHLACIAGHESLVRMLGSMAEVFSVSLTREDGLPYIIHVMWVMGP
jgi:ankyrin repeat protein